VADGQAQPCLPGEPRELLLPEPTAIAIAATAVAADEQAVGSWIGDHPLANPTSANAVAAGGVLLVVSHDLAPMRAPIDTQAHRQVFDPDAHVRAEDFAAALADAPDWVVEAHEKRPRPATAAPASHHVDDVVLCARRRAG
jgi:non-ribosomal peptide synthetase component F